MKTNNLFLAFFMLITLIGCKKEVSEQEQNQPVEKLDNAFTVTLNAVVKQDDSFQLYYKDLDEAPYEEKNSMFIEFKGKAEPQDITFKLPQDELPSFFRLDFGTNKAQEEILVNSLKISYLDKTIEAKGLDFYKYFVVNEATMDKDSLTTVLKPKITKEGTYDPITYSNMELYNELQKLIK
ncbi:hypothetical protein [Flavobacterium sp.]|uniref:hypothetical protein n=1 Tax=Flavobacterium sp. TaxID=239 RepID=UPI0035291456